MITDEILALYDQHERIGAVYPDARKDTLTHADGSPALVRFLRQPPGHHVILYSHFSAHAVDAAIAEQVRLLSATHQNYDWKICPHDSPPDLGKRLMDAGFEADDEARIMSLELSSAPASLLAAAPADIRLVARKDQLAGVAAVLAAVWGGSFDWVHQRLGLHMDTPGYIEIYAAYVEGIPACVGWTYFQPGSAFASLWAGSTLPQYRGRGLYTALTAARVQSALRRGRRYAIVSAGEMSAPIVARHGFTELTRDLTYEHPGG